LLKATTGSALALTITILLAGCAKEQPPAKATTAPETAASASLPAEAHPVPSAAPGVDVDLSGIAKAEGGKTVEEVFAEKDQLAGTKVSFRGKVVKVNPEIMGKNWLHVRDGSGAGPTSDLTVTTEADLPKVGDTVLVTGIVGLDRDFGLGYQYDVIIEDAELFVE
jgi:hypothetical protein